MEEAKKMIKKMIITAIVFILTTCNSGMAGEFGKAGSGKTTDRSQRTVVDAAKYTDFTAKNVWASKYTRQDVMADLNGTFKIAGGNSYITIDRREGTITLSSDDAWEGDTGGHNMYAKYSFDVQAANEDCLYIKMDTKTKAQMIMDYKTYLNQEVPDLAVCLPLYGYSRNRIEVSPVMDGYIAMPSGTYWAGDKKK
jgi:hypothetical protein